jgi:hypothetical protein
MKQFIYKLNHRWHKPALIIFMVIVIAHLLEHIFQTLQVYFLQWPRGHAHGLLGYYYPLLAQSEWLHYIYAFIMLVGLYILRLVFSGKARVWWDVSLIIQIWHHTEHFILLMQNLIGYNLFNSAKPMSLIEIFVPRVELHFFYNAVVFIPMVIAIMYVKKQGDSNGKKHS